jgi:multicomponent Na+:H+ antiporter subunit D
VLWLVTTIYAIGYLENAPHRSRFFGFFSLCVSATVGLALAGNLFTFVIFFELLTLVTYPLVAHRGTAEAVRGARIYLTYTLGGGMLLLIGTVWLYVLAGPMAFVEGGILYSLPAEYHPQLKMIFLLLIMGLGVKAALVPLHGWLPQAMVAPAPVSALLHAVAVVKAGAFGIIRVVYDVYGVNFADQLGLLTGLGIAAAITIVYGSVMALFQDNLKKRLAYSTVSQVSYIALGTAILGPIGTIGGVVHLVHQGIMKITLFFTAGNYAETLGIHKVSEMNGVGRRMPATTLAFSIAALGMIGVPPVAGFVSKWYLGLGALEAGMASWVMPVLITSSVLNAAYFLPVLYRAWFREPGPAWPAEHIPAARFETSAALLWPPVVTASLALAAGLFAAAPYSPLEWATLIAHREYGL